MLTGGDATPGELVRLELILKNEIAALWGHVVYNVSEMGLAVRFSFGNDVDQRLLDRLIEVQP